MIAASGIQIDTNVALSGHIYYYRRCMRLSRCVRTEEGSMSELYFAGVSSCFFL